MRHISISTLFLKFSLIILALSIIAISFLSLPQIANDFALNNPEYSFLQYPLLIGIWATLIPFNIAIYKAFIFLDFAKKSEFNVDKLKQYLHSISKCAVAIIGLYICGMTLLMATNASHPGLMLFGLAVIAICLIIIASSQFIRQYIFRSYQVT